MAHSSGFRVFGVYIPTGQDDSAVRNRVMSYLDTRVKIAGEAGELVAVGGGLQPGYLEVRRVRPAAAAPSSHQPC